MITFPSERGQIKAIFGRRVAGAPFLLVADFLPVSNQGKNMEWQEYVLVAAAGGSLRSTPATLNLNFDHSHPQRHPQPPTIIYPMQVMKLRLAEPGTFQSVLIHVRQ